MRRKGGSCLNKWRNFVCGVMILIGSTTLHGQTTGRALVHSDGGTWLNDSPAPAISAIFPLPWSETLDRVPRRRSPQPL